MGGPSGMLYSGKSLIDTPVTYEDINKTGAIVGSGGMIVMDEDTCMVDMARYFLNFTRDESCGKCNYCRIGTKRMLEILEKGSPEAKAETAISNCWKNWQARSRTARSAVSDRQLKPCSYDDQILPERIRRPYLQPQVYSSLL